MPGKLLYFDLGARGELIRALCFLKDFEYENKLLSFEEFGAMKADPNSPLPLGSLPVWEEDGMTIAQSNAILRMLGMRTGMYSQDAKIMWEIDSLLDFMEENWAHANSYGVATLFKGGVFTEETEEQWKGYWTKMIPFLAGRLAKHDKKWVAGTDEMTVADLKAYHTFVLFLEHPSNPTPEEQKEFARTKIAEHPRLAQYVRELSAAMQPWMNARS